MGQRLVQIRADPERLTPKFLLQYLLNVLQPDRIGQMMVGSTARHLNVRDLKSLPVPLPPLAAQETYAAAVDAVERHREVQSAHLVSLGALFASLQASAFTGDL
jgi:type I restriction enzyme S subunit